ncbi:MAG: AAA family ATPase, partial [candidate division WOR-3 bacterium]
KQYANIPNLAVINNSDCQSLLNFVNFKSNTPPFLSSLFASYLVVDNYQQIISLRQQFPQYAFVTKTGIILNHDGILIIPPKTNSVNSSNLNNQIYSLEQEISLLESKNVELLKEIEVNHRNKQSKEIEKNTVNEELKKIQTLIIEKRKTNKENLEKASNFLYELNKRREEIIQIQAAMAEIKLTQNQKQTLSEEKNRLLKELTELKNEASVLQNNINNLKAKLANQQQILQEHTPTLLTARYDDIDKKIILLRSDLDNIRQKLNALQYQKLEIITQRQVIEKQAQDYLENGIELLKSNVITKPIDDIKKELSLVSRKITAIGMINPLARDDYQREKNELDRLTSQYQDIVKAQTNLNLALSELTKKAEQMFLATYDKVKISFRQIFKDIFSEGEADLILETPTNPLDSDIRIIAQPKGKSPRRLDQLSDGEKALLALSLLFAFYDIKPAPFVFMDEVDAPLDDANVKRFTNFLKRITQTTQVIIITHNKLTIESAAVVIGVTTEEPGISKIVSVRFKDTIASVKS